MNDSTALGTGANKGIGKEIARLLVAAGVRVHLGSRAPERGRAAAEEIGATSRCCRSTSPTARVSHGPRGSSTSWTSW
nr:SDR family NAD(P)-dependent oxidoreductase [Actinopolyspora erythraea]